MSAAALKPDAAPVAPAPEPEKTSQRQHALGTLPEAYKQALLVRQQENAVAAKIAETNWGKGLDHDTRRAVTEWGRRNGIDVTRHIDVLGGRIYLNANYYLEQLGRLVQAGAVDYAFADHVNEDPRLAALGEPGTRERVRRAEERVRHNVPDKAAAAVVFRVKLKSTPVEFTGVKWTGGGTRKNDPVGDLHPVETAETRAARRCMRLLVSHLPALADVVQRAEDDAGATVSELIERSRAALRLDRATELQREISRGGMPILNDGYTATMDLANRQPGREIPSDAPTPRASFSNPVLLGAAATLRDPYDGPPATQPDEERVAGREPGEDDEGYQDDRDLDELPLNDARPRRSRNAQQD